MKNKKLFAILTLVCFMMTLMPVAAFAAVPDGIDYQESSVFTEDEDASEKTGQDLTVQFDFVNTAGHTVSELTGTTNSVYVWFVKSGSNVATTSVTMGNTKPDPNGVFEIQGAESGEDYNFQFSNSGTYTVRAAFDNPSDLKTANKTLAECFSDVEYKLSTVSGQNSFEITSSSSSSDYGASITGPKMRDADGKEIDTIKVTDYGDVPEDANWNKTGEGSNVKYDYVGDDGEWEIVSGVISANNVSEKEFTVKIVDKDGKAVKGETVTLDTNSSNIELNKEKATTDTLGQIKFKITGVRDGDYKVYIKCGSYESTINVTVGATGAYNIQVVKSPSAPVDTTTQFDENHDKIQFSFTDANGNAVTTDIAKKNGAVAAFNSDKNPVTVGGVSTNAKPYVAIVSQPSASDLENEDLKLVEDKDGDDEYKANLWIDDSDDLAEGTYEIKVVLDNGNYATVSFEVKEFGTPVALNLEYEADAVEIGSYVAIDTLEWVDKDGVTKDCTDKIDLAATGYAVERFYTDKGECDTHKDAKGKSIEHSTGTIDVKDDDKYVGSTITVIAVDDRYNLTAQATITVADEATELAFDTKTLAIDANNKVGVAVVDGSGNKVALNRGKSADISYVVLDKPEGSKVSVTTDGADNDILTKGTFTMNVTANTVGNVTIQAVAKVTQEDNVVKYYTGSQIFAVGKDSVGDVVVMSIGSSEVVVNGDKVAIDSAPMIQNDRTYVPFRALAEAFGAEVAYDEATQAVTAELNGVTVVMTIGSATYTVNGAEQTMDVAPFISGSRTMIPVRFAAEAFGIKVIPTYNPDGSTADILFNL